MTNEHNNAAQTDWRELCRRLYVELWHCDKQMTSGARPKWKQGTAVRDVLRDANLALEATPAAAPAPTCKESLKVAPAPAVPQGYALISVDALQAWGKLDEVKATCVYPTTAAAPSHPVRGMPDVATWLWFRFVDYCRKQSMTPRHQKGLFAIVHDLRTMLASTTPPVHAAAQEPVTLTDSYAGVIAWIGDKQCKLLVTEDAIKHEHTPGVVMRNAAHQCVQEVIIAALRGKEQAK